MQARVEIDPGPYVFEQRLPRRHLEVVGETVDPIKEQRLAIGASIASMGLLVYGMYRAGKQLVELFRGESGGQA